MFLWIERKVEGDRNARIKLDASPMSARKLGRKAAKHFLWLALAIWTGFTFVGYFTPIRGLWGEAFTLSFGPWEWFWVNFYGLATYGNAGFLREQVCKYMCPYARFQSAMFDKDTLIVSYDATRGEPRGARSRKADPGTLALGSCVSCNLCVHVCPTGIDIRNGLQYECIGCAGCIDVCNSVMDRMGYARGLIRFTTQNAMAKRWTRPQIVRHVLRPRVLVYGTVLLSLCFALAWSLAMRTPLKVDVVRDRAALSRIVAGGKLENVYRLQIMNATEQQQRYRIKAEGLPGLTLASDAEVAVGAAESRWVAVRLQIPYGSAAPGSHPIHFEVKSLADHSEVKEKAAFLVPR
jgi:cytochrome c oxidase accessory protein FixG